MRISRVKRLPERAVPLHHLRDEATALQNLRDAADFLLNVLHSIFEA